MHISIWDGSVSNGAGLVALTYSSTGLIAYFIRPGDVAPTEITLADIAVLGTYESGGFKQVDAVHMPGLYEIHIPNACLATGAEQTMIMYHGASNMVPKKIEIQLS